jgi:hypothetical protein
MDHPPSDGAELVLAMPARELFAVTGFTTELAMPVLESLGEESWFALPEAIREDPMAREVRLGMVIVRGTPGAREVLAQADGTILGLSALLPEHLPGTGLGALKRHAQAVARARSGLPAGATCGVEVVGYIHDGKLPDLRHVVVAVYRAVVAPETPAPGEASWLRAASLTGLRLAPLCALVARCVDPQRPR